MLGTMRKLLPTRRQWLTGFSMLALALTGGKPAEAGWLPAYRVTTPPRPLPPVTFVTEDGTGQKLADFRGRIVLLNVWATWCAPCVLEMPSLNRLQEELGGPDFTVLPVATRSGDAARVRRFYEQNGITALPVLLDPTNTILPTLHDRILPLSVLINREGLEIGRSTGSGDWSGAQALLTIKRALADGG